MNNWGITIGTCLLAVFAVAGQKTVLIPDARSASYDSLTNTLFVADGKEVRAIHISEGFRTSQLPETEGATHVVVNRTRNLVVLAPAENGLRVSSIERLGCGFSRTEVIENVDVPMSVHKMDANNILLLGDQGRTGQVLNIPTLNVSSKIKIIEGLIYSTLPGLDVRKDSIFVPGGYPGQIVQLNTSNKLQPSVTTQISTTDWIHDVIMLGDTRAIVAGHLEGVSIVNIEQGSAIVERHLLDSKHAQLLLEGNILHAFSKDRVEHVDILTHAVTTDSIEAISDQSFGAMSPLGRDSDGRMMILEEGSGVHFLEG